MLTVCSYYVVSSFSVILVVSFWGSLKGKDS